MESEIRIGVLGLGRMGRIHCEQIRAAKGLSLVAASSRAPEPRSAAVEGSGIRAYTRHEDLLADPKVKWVVIATYTHEHQAWALKAIEAGKNVIVEKPVALSYEEAREIFRAAEERGVQATVYQNRRWDRDFLLVRRVLAQGLLGDVYRIESRFTRFSGSWGGWGARGEEHPWRLMKEYGGGMLSDWGPHLADQLLLIAQAPVRSVLGRLESRIWSSEVDDHFWAEILFADGVTARLEASNNHRFVQPRWLVLGSAGTLQVTGDDPSVPGTAVLRGEEFGFRQEIRFDTAAGAGPELHGDFYDAFTAALQSDDPLPVEPAESLAVMKLMDGVRESARSGQVLEL